MLIGEWIWLIEDQYQGDVFSLVLILFLGGQRSSPLLLDRLQKLNVEA